MSCHNITYKGKPAGVICVGHGSPPTKMHECPEAVNSIGRACKKCKVDCYRRGWDKISVDADNRRIVTANWAALKEDKS